MREYELYLVIDADAEEEVIGALVERASALVAAVYGDTNGEVIKVEDRGKRRLAYPIKKKVEGHDILVTFQAPPQALTELERLLRLDEHVLRHLLVRMGED